jgi:hypothetical protein
MSRVSQLPRLEPLRSVRADALEVAYYEAGPGDGEVALLDALGVGRDIATLDRAAVAFDNPDRVHHQVPNAGHNLPQEAPDAFARAVLELAGLRSPSEGVRR